MDQQEGLETTTTSSSLDCFKPTTCGNEDDATTVLAMGSRKAAAAGRHDDRREAGGEGKAGRFAMLTRFHGGYFRISLALSGQALLWRTLALASTTEPLGMGMMGMGMGMGMPSLAFLLLWCLALLSLLALCALYALRCLLRFQAVRAEFRHHVAMNYLFAPWISWLLLLQSAPPFPFLHAPSSSLHMGLWCAFSLPILALDVKIYGQWFTRGRKFLSMVANPASHIIVTARAAAKMGWHEGAIAIFAVGAAHYFGSAPTRGCGATPAASKQH